MRAAVKRSDFPNSKDRVNNEVRPGLGLIDWLI